MGASSIALLPEPIAEWARAEIGRKARMHGRRGWHSERAHKWSKGAGQTRFKRQRMDRQGGPFENEWTAICPLDGCRYQLGYSCDH